MKTELESSTSDDNFCQGGQKLEFKSFLLFSSHSLSTSSALQYTD